MVNIKINSFCQEDATLLLDMLKKLAEFHNEFAHISIEQILYQLSKTQNLAKCWLAWHDDKPVGFLIAYDWMNFIRGKKVRHIDLIYVEEQFRGKGVGKALIKYIAQSAIEDGCQRMDVSALENNLHANQFYTSLGFQAHLNHSVKYKIQDQSLLDLSTL
jgi:GNAT superfamily N-acetyltransferase